MILPAFRLTRPRQRTTTKAEVRAGPDGSRLGSRLSYPTRKEGASATDSVEDTPCNRQTERKEDLMQRLVLWTATTLLTGSLCISGTYAQDADEDFFPPGPGSGSVGSVDDPPADDSETNTWGDIINLDEYPGPLGRVAERVDHETCDRCFTAPGMGESSAYQVWESVNVDGMEHLIAREVPNPAPLEEGEVREILDPETGEPVWYIGYQAHVGPTDDKRFSPKHPYSKITMIRIKSRHEGKIFAIPGVHGFGIGEDGFDVIMYKPPEGEQRASVPTTLEGVPVRVVYEDRMQLTGHQENKFRPVPAGAGIGSQYRQGTLGPHVVSTTGGCCKIWSLTAGHVLKQNLNDPSPTPGENPVYQPAARTSINLFGRTLYAFALTPCGTEAQCGVDTAYVNRTNTNPDIGLIDPLPTNTLNTPPFQPSGTDPTRHLQYGKRGGDYHNGPSGRVIVASRGHYHRIWGSWRAATSKGKVKRINLTRTLIGGDGNNYKICCVNEVDLWTDLGDSGALVAYSGTSNRHVAGVNIGRKVENGRHVRGAYYIKANDITAALARVGRSISHFWGTKSDYRSPSETQCDHNDCS